MQALSASAPLHTPVLAAYTHKLRDVLYNTLLRVFRLGVVTACCRDALRLWLPTRAAVGLRHYCVRADGTTV